MNLSNKSQITTDPLVFNRLMKHWIQEDGESSSQLAEIFYFVEEMTLRGEGLSEAALNLLWPADIPKEKDFDHLAMNLAFQEQMEEASANPEDRTKDFQCCICRENFKEGDDAVVNSKCQFHWFHKSCYLDNYKNRTDTAKRGHWPTSDVEADGVHQLVTVMSCFKCRATGSFIDRKGKESPVKDGITGCRHVAGNFARPTKDPVVWNRMALQFYNPHNVANSRETAAVFSAKKSTWRNSLYVTVNMTWEPEESEEEDSNED